MQSTDITPYLSRNKVFNIIILNKECFSISIIKYNHTLHGYHLDKPYFYNSPIIIYSFNTFYRTRSI